MAATGNRGSGLQTRTVGRSANEMRDAINRARDNSLLDQALEAYDREAVGRELADRNSLDRSIRQTQFQQNGPWSRDTLAALRRNAERYQARQPVAPPSTVPRVLELSAAQKRMLARNLGRGILGRLVPGAQDFVDELWSLGAAPKPLTDPNKTAMTISPLLEALWQCDGQSGTWWDQGSYQKTVPSGPYECYTLQAGNYGDFDPDLGTGPVRIHEAWWRYLNGQPARWRSGQVWLYPGSANPADQHVRVPLADAAPPPNNGGLPATAVAPAPRPSQSFRRAAGRVTNPLGIRGERNAAGPVAVNPRAGAGADFVVQPGGFGGYIPPVHRQEPPGPATRESKRSVYSFMGAAGAAALRIVGVFGEATDVLDVFYEALPDEFKPRGNYIRARREYLPPSFSQRMAALYEHWDKVDLNAAVDGLILNQFEDRFYGLLGEIANRGVNKRLHSVGFLTGPWDSAAPYVSLEE